jgi:hypothetical protein
MLETPVICFHCMEVITSNYQQTFIGFRKYHCPGCGKKVIYPLPTLYVAIYVIILVLFGSLFVVNLMAGRLAIPGLLVVVGIAGLIVDFSIRRKVKLIQDKFMIARVSAVMKDESSAE